jgi:hypothetical protein
MDSLRGKKMKGLNEIKLCRLTSFWVINQHLSLVLLAFILFGAKTGFL